MLEGLSNKTQHCLIYGTQHQQHKVMFYPCFLTLLVGGWGGIFCSIVLIAHKRVPHLSLAGNRKHIIMCLHTYII